MTAHTQRRSQSLLVWLRATVIALATYGGLVGMQFNPGWGAAALSLAAGALSVAAVDLGIIVALVALTLPLAAANAVIGILFAVISVVGVRYLGADGGAIFLLIAGAIAGSVFGPAWVIVPLAGYALGVGEGALAAAAACLALETYGMVLGGGATLGRTLLLGQGDTLVSFSQSPATLFSTRWIAASVNEINVSSVNRVVDAAVTVEKPMALLVQPLIWAVGASATGMLVARARRSARPLPMWGLAVVSGVALAAAGVTLLYTASGLPAPVLLILVSAAGSITLAVAIMALFEGVFPYEKALEPESKPVQMSSMSMEDADVDELLRLVATAEDKLASQHTTTKVVMITDMKAFSKMTEEDGSILSAKSIQKHRDLLIPIIQRHGGHGKSTGGDGLVSAFDTAQSAVAAAVEMQQALAEYSSVHPDERELSVRLGIAEGEVVLDKGGRPFIGTALNLAARVMNLADGGQAFATAEVAKASSGTVPTFGHGAFQLKNISKPVEVVELLWGPNQIPKGPQDAVHTDL